MATLMDTTPLRPRVDPIVPWGPELPEPQLDRTGRPAASLIGALVGLGIAGGCVALGIAPGVGGAQSALPTLAAGTVGGWLMGPAAERARRNAEWVRAVLGLALCALVIGAIGSGIALAVEPEPWMDTVGPFEIAGRAIIYALLGMLFLGIPAFLTLLIPAAVWALIMHAALRRI